MSKCLFVAAGTIAVSVVVLNGAPAPAQGPQAPVATFKTGVDLVRVTAVVRDRRGRFVEDLSKRDFEVIDNGAARPITDFRRYLSGISAALLFDVSGSMEGNLGVARDAATHLLSWLDARDEASVYSFHTRLDEMLPFTAALKTLPPSMSAIKPFGATSLHDAIAQTARKASGRDGRRRAVVVFTDGNDNASRLTPVEVSAIASEIDVPVYIFAVVASIDNPESDRATSSAQRSALAGPLAKLAAWTGGHVFIASSAAERALAARQIIDELRHQYLIAFESSGKPGWHPLVVRARDRDLVVRARSSYINGQSRPNS